MHLPPTMCATKGLAGRPEAEPMMGQLAGGQGLAEGGLLEQQSPLSA